MLARMPTPTLAPIPEEPRTRELWLQHLAGYILFEDARRYALDRLDPNLSPEARAAAQQGIDDALYGMMMIVDGVSGSVKNASHEVNLRMSVRLVQRQDHQVLEQLDLFDGDGMCMGYHGWLKGDFGEAAIVTAPEEPKRPGRRR
jgi:hypothetical protein